MMWINKFYGFGDLFYKKVGKFSRLLNLQRIEKFVIYI